MKFQDFKEKYGNSPVIFTRDVVLDVHDSQTIRNQLLRWQKRGLVMKLKRGVYVINETDRKVAVDKQYLANVLYEPSYVSLEYALNLYGLIPEGVRDVTSVTTRKTMRIKNALGVFVYQHMKPKAFRGFRKTSKENWASLIAEPEKALVDFLYFHLSRFGKNAEEALIKSYRLQHLDMLREEKLGEFGRLFGSKKLLKVIESVCRLRRKESV